MKKLFIIISLLLTIVGCSNDMYSYGVSNGRYALEEITENKLDENRTGQIIAYYPSGHMAMSLEGFLFNAPGKGNVARVENYVNGKLEGKTLKYFKEGKLSEEINYVAGKKDGLSISYAIDGSVLSQTKYKNDLIVQE